MVVPSCQQVVATFCGYRYRQPAQIACVRERLTFLARQKDRRFCFTATFYGQTKGPQVLFVYGHRTQGSLAKALLLLLFDRLPVKQSLNLILYFLTLSLIFNSHFCKHVLIFVSPDGPLLVIYVNAFLFTTNATFLTIVNKNNYNKEFPNQLYIQRKSHNVCYIQSCYIADICTERVTHFRLSSTCTPRVPIFKHAGENTHRSPFTGHCQHGCPTLPTSCWSIDGCIMFCTNIIIMMAV